MIKGVRRFVGASVARRLFVLFVLCAFLPLALIALLSLSQVRALLLQQGEQRLAATAKSYGMALFERLLLAGELATAVGSNPDNAMPPDALALRAYHSLALAAPQGAPRDLIGKPRVPAISAQGLARIAAGKPVVLIEAGADAARIWVAAPLPGQGGRFAVGELKPEFLWGSAEELPAMTEFCVLEEGSKAVLHCSAPMSPAMLKRLAAPGTSSLGAASWANAEETFQARAWTQFMRDGLGTPDWVVVASQPEQFQLARVLEFRDVYIPVVLLTLLLVTWLTIRQSRDIVEPVTQLAERARGIAKNDFQSRLDLKRDDEFGELAGAFDQMSQRLGRQFASLTALSEIDRLILSTQDTAQVVRIILHRIGDALPADIASVTLFDSDDPDRARTYYRPCDVAESMSMERHEIPAEERAALEALRGGAWVSLPEGEALPSYLGPLRKEGMASAFVQPIVWGGAVCGALTIGLRGAPSALNKDEMQQTRELADRVAVAVSSAWRDEKLYQQAHFDPLTGLPNRLLFKDRVGREIARSQRGRLTFALLFIDLDHFKNVNDSFGHTTGDEVLREAARRIARCLRETDTVARLGGDEFTVLLTGLNQVQEAWLLSEAIVAALSQEFVLGEQRCFLSASVGISSFPADGSSAEELLKSADTAMYRAKASGRAQSVYFEEKMNRETVARVTLDRDLRVAIERGELVMHYQPQLDLRTGAIRGAEALVRWNHPVHGRIAPSRFIPLAEESGFIERLGQWTLQQVCAQLKSWRAEGLPLERVSVNVSPRQFRRHGLVDFIRGCVEGAGVPSSCLQIEITEGLLVDRGETVESSLHELAASGHGIALDDFGTGFSSMAYLMRFPVHVIKIDRIFVDGMSRGTDSEAIVAAIIAMSHALGKTVVAEGAETAEQVAILRRLQCDEIQGFFVAPALPPGEFAELVRARQVDVAA